MLTIRIPRRANAAPDHLLAVGVPVGIAQVTPSEPAISRESGTAQIRVASKPPGARLKVSDQGRRIQADLRAHQDAPFASGVGMAGARDRAEELGGEPWIESSDQGTEVVVTLPVGQEERNG